LHAYNRGDSTFGLRSEAFMQQLHPGGGAASPLQQRIAAHLAGVVTGTPLDRAPFDHLVLTGIFPADVYPQLLKLLPAASYYRELKHSDAILPDGRSARLQFPLVAENIARLPEGARQFWAAVAGAVKSREVETAYKNKFRETLERVTGKSLASIRLRPDATLFRDIGGYKISIHPDSPRKAITTQFYLPADESQLHLGTLFHARNADGSYREARAMRFAPNSGYAFAVSPISYHSVNPMRPDDKPRDSLMIMFKYDRGPLIEGFKAARNKLRGWYDRLRGKTGAAEEGEGGYEAM
jgi:hypothetical protein